MLVLVRGLVTMTTEPLRALSLIQPWAWLVVNGHKPIENRRWKLWSSMVGKVALIHASASMPDEEYEDVLELTASIDPAIVLPARGELPLGGIVGAVRFVGCKAPVPGVENPLSLVPRPKDDPWWFRTQYGFVLEEPRPLPFVRCRGKQGFWQVPPEVKAALAMEGI